MTISSRRAKYLAIAALFLSLLFFVVTLLLGAYCQVYAVFAVSFFLLSSALVWFVLLVQFHQRSLAEQEKLDISAMSKERQSSTIFTEQSKEAGVFAVANRRLRLLERWFVPIFGAVIAVYQIAIGLYLLYAAKHAAGAEAEIRQPLLGAVLLTGVAFVSFLVSRYGTGMSAEPRFKPLRAGGGILLGSAILCFILAVCLALVQFKFPVPIKVASYVIPALLVILGVETALNGVLDIYRPRIKDQYQRAAFDSRLLGIINEPGETLHTVAGAIDYQFGFKVSQTWFYKLLAKAIVPLILFGAAVLYLLSCVVVVNPDEQAVVERFGNPLTDSGQVRLLDAGIALKYPWPIDTARKFQTTKVRELYIGYQPKIDPKTNLPAPEEQLIWGRKHYEKEEPVIVASEQTGTTSIAGVVPVSLINANIPVQYRVKDLYSFLYKHKDPDKLLEAICYRELAKLAAGATIEVDSAEQLARSILGAGRSKAKDILSARIQQAADAQQLGVEIVFVGIQGIHPPVKVATDYQKVVASVQKKQASILDAYTVRNITLSNLAGSVEQANKIYEFALKYDQGVRNNSSQTKQMATQLDDAFGRASGEIFETLRKAKSYAYEKATLAEATGKRFADQLKAYREAEDIYKHNLRLDVLEEATEKIRKYVVVADPNDFQIFIINMQEKLTPSLYDITGLKEPEEK